MTDKITLEICTNVEWLTEYGHCIERGDYIQLDHDAADGFIDSLRTELLARLPEAEIVSARDQRQLCHGWNGAHFTHRAGPVGTWDHLSDSQIDAIHVAVEAAKAAVKHSE